MIRSTRFLSFLASVLSVVTVGSVAQAAIVVQPTAATVKEVGSGSTNVGVGYNPINLYNGSGLSNAASVANGVTVPAVWPTNNQSYNNDLVTYQFGSISNNFTFTLDAPYNLTGIYLWNFNENYQGSLNTRGMKDTNVSFSTDGTSFSTPVPVTFAKSNGTAADPGAFYALTPVTAQYVRITTINNWYALGDYGADPNIVGMGEVRFTAEVPEPASLGLLGLAGLAAMRRRRRIA